MSLDADASKLVADPAGATRAPNAAIGPWWGNTATPVGVGPAATFVGVLAASTPPAPTSYCDTLVPAWLAT